MIQLIASIVLMYAVVGSAAVWYRRAKARSAAMEEDERIREQSIP